MYLLRGVFQFLCTPEQHLLRLSLSEIPAEDLSRLKLFEVTELDESRSVSQWSLHVNILQYSTKNLTIPQLLPKVVYFFQMEHTSDIKLTNLLNSLAVTLNW